MKLDLTQYSIDELIEIKDIINNLINSHEDGFIYICKIRHYGRNWVERPKNLHSLENLSYEYNGEDGIMDVYSNNPNLSDFYNYGDVFYIESEEDYNKWKNYDDLNSFITWEESKLVEWENRDSLSYYQRPMLMFEPTYKREDLEDLKKNLSEMKMSFVPPRKVNDNEWS
jgi:hypothetical protein